MTLPAALSYLEYPYRVSQEALGLCRTRVTCTVIIIGSPVTRTQKRDGQPPDVPKRMAMWDPKCGGFVWEKWQRWIFWAGDHVISTWSTMPGNLRINKIIPRGAEYPPRLLSHDLIHHTIKLKLNIGTILFVGPPKTRHTRIHISLVSCRFWGRCWTTPTPQSSYTVFSKTVELILLAKS